MMERIIGILHDGGHSLVIENLGETRVFDGRGVADIYRLYSEDPDFLSGACLADKVIGKGAAAIMILGGVSMIYADVMSRNALELLARTEVKAEYGELTDHIINRAGTGWCPVETLCRECTTPEECLERIAIFLSGRN